MNYQEPTYYRTERVAVGPIRVRRTRLVGFLVIAAVVAAVIGYESRPSSTLPASVFAQGTEDPHHKRRGGLGEDGGAMPDHTTVFDDGVPGVTNLDDSLLAAARRASVDASSAGISLYVDSGWRSPEYQQHLLDEAISKYGSVEEASRWVARPDRSAHVSGDAIDIGPSEAASWLSEHGATYGLCRIYDNEAWHFELRPEAASTGCPAMYADAAHDPRLQ